MISLILVSLMCPDINIVNLTIDWETRDSLVLEYVQKRCGEIYPKSPCLKIFTKKEDGVYNAVCGVLEDEIDIN